MLQLIVYFLLQTSVEALDTWGTIAKTFLTWNKKFEVAQIRSNFEKCTWGHM